MNWNKIYFAADKEGAGAGNMSAPATDSSTQNPQNTETKDIVDVLHFDPFKKGEEIPDPEDKKPTESGKTGKAKAGAGNENTPPAEDKTPLPPKKDAAPASPPSADDQTAHYKTLMEHYKEIAEGKTKEEPKVEDKDTIPEYNFTIPDQLIEVLTTDDVGKFKTGVTALAKGIATAVHAQMMAHMDTRYNPRFESIPQTIAKAMQAIEQHRTVESDFYGTYPELNNPALRNFVKTTGEAVAKKMGKKAWDAELRDAIAAEVKGVIAAAAGSARNGQDRSTPPRMLPSQGSRPSAPANDEAKDIADTLFSGF